QLLVSQQALEAIPTDSRFRDALVLYCEVADAADARRIAQLCWSEARRIGTGEAQVGDPSYVRAIHCLRFLGAAFRSRPEALEGFRDELGQLVLKLVGPESDMLLAKHAFEVANLLDGAVLEEALRICLERKSVL